MGSAWGNSWGASWGNSWGQSTGRPQKIYQEIWIIEGKPRKGVRRKQKKARRIAQEIETALKVGAKRLKAGNLTEAQAENIKNVVTDRALELKYEYERLSQELKYVQETINAKEKALAQIKQYTQSFERAVKAKKLVLRQQEEDDLETLYLFMMFL